jgi:hypothetical protein
MCLRFGIKSGTFEAATWNCFVSKTTPDIYLTCRSLGSLKASMHESGSWQIGFTEEYWDSAENTFDKSKIRHLDIWERPKEMRPGEILAFRIITPSSEVNLNQVDHKKGICWIPNAPDDMVTEMDVWITKSGFIQPGSEDDRIIGSLSVPKGEVVWITYRVYSISNLAKQIQCFRDKCKEGNIVRWDRLIGIGAEVDGSRLILDIGNV